MFLNELKANEKDAFLELARLAAESNGIISSEQRALLEMYGHEMKIDHSVQKVAVSSSLEALAKIFGDKSKNIVFIELLALICSDGVYDELEKEFVNKLMSNFGFEQDKCERYIRWVKEINALYAEGLKLINE